MSIRTRCIRHLLLAAWAGAHAACLGSVPAGGLPPASPLGRSIPAFPARPRPAPPDKPKGVVLLPQALAAALWHNPELRAYSWEVRARDAERIQAALLPNPEVGLEGENLGLSGRLAGIPDLEITLAVSQLVLLGGDRAARTRLAALRTQVAGWKYETKRLEVLTKTAKAFAGVVAAQRRLTLVGRQRRLVRQLVILLRERAAAGKIAENDPGLLAAELRLARIELALERLRLQFETAKARLAAMWGGRARDLRAVRGRIEPQVSLPDDRTVARWLAESPHLQVERTRLAAARAAIRLERAKGVPDLELSIGLRVLPADGSTGFVFGAGIPIPLFDRNQGSVAAARYRAKKARQEVLATKSALRAAVADALAAARSSRQAIHWLRNRLLPQARRGADAALQAYRMGKLSYLPVLDAHSVLMELELEQLQAQLRLFRAIVDLEFLLGRPLGGTRTTPEPAVRTTARKKERRP